VTSFLDSLSDQRLLDAAGVADDLARDGHEGARVIAEVAGQAVTDEIAARWGLK
jgi:hypothetical protein